MASRRALLLLLLVAASRSANGGFSIKPFALPEPPPGTDPESFQWLCSEYEERWVQGSGTVRYGDTATGVYSYTVVTSEGETLIKCNNDEREGDPMFGVVKACWWTGEMASGRPTEEPTPGPTVDPSLTFQTVCVENESVELTGPGWVRYGDFENDIWTYREYPGDSDMRTSIWCSNAVFGDPDYGTVKLCQWSGAMPETEPPTAAPTVDPALTFTFVAEEGQAATLIGPGTIRYGAEGEEGIGNYVYFDLELAAGEQRSLWCTNEVAGRDPIYGTVKACYYSGDSIAAPTPSPVDAPTPGPVDGEPGDPYVRVCGEYESCVVNEDGLTPGRLRYGLSGYYVWKHVTTRTEVECSNSWFGRDPIYGWVKACYWLPDNTVLDFSRPKVSAVKPKKKVVTKKPTKKPTPNPTKLTKPPSPTKPPTARKGKGKGL